jgi:hypothetical protein
MIFKIISTAYVEFESVQSQQTSKEMNNQVFKTKSLKVDDKIKDIPKHLGKRGTN